MKSCALLLSLLLTFISGPAWAEESLVTGPDRRQEIDLRLESLDAERAKISTRGPAIGTAVGLGTVALGGVLLGVGVAQCDGRASEYGPCTGPGSGIGAQVGGVVMMIAGGSITLISGIVLGRRASRRDKIDAEIESLIDERKGLKATLSRLELKSPHRNGTQFVTLGFDF